MACFLVPTTEAIVTTIVEKNVEYEFIFFIYSDSNRRQRGDIAGNKIVVYLAHDFLLTNMMI